MTADDVVTALALPEECRVDERISKRLLIEHGQPTAADKRQIETGIEELQWLAALKPTTIGIPEYRDEHRNVVEVAVLSLAMRDEARPTRLAELIHRAVPHPLLLVARQGATLTLSLAGKRLSQSEAGKSVLEDSIIACELTEHPATAPFVESLAIARHTKAHLHALYQGWIACLEAYQAALVTGRFGLPTEGEVIAARRLALADRARLTREIAGLRAQAARESQISRRVELNLKIKQLDAELTQANAQL